MSQQASNQQDQMLRGTLWLTTANFASRLLGAVYIIPWYSWMRPHADQANALFTMGYNIYAIFLLMSTTGINVAVAKQISKYNTLGRPEMSDKLIRSFLQLMLGAGLISALVMFLASPIFADISGEGPALIPVMHSLSWGVLVFPAMSVMRGIFQGHNNMKPYAVSQLAEQLIRVIWMLVTTYLIMKMGSKDYVEAVVQSTFAAFIGMLASVVVLVYYLHKMGLLNRIIRKPQVEESVDTKAILVETLKEAVPFIITGSAVQIFQLIDQFTFINSMRVFTTESHDQLKVLFAYISANPNKIFMILIAVATAIGGVGIPLLTENFIKEDKEASAKLVINSLTMLQVFLLPATAGAILLAKPLYTVFYSLPDGNALGLFILAMISALFLGFYSVLAPMIQALFENRNAIRYFLYGTIVKLSLQLPFIYVFKSYGPLLSTIIGLAVPIVFMYGRIQEMTDLDHKLLVKRSLLIGLQTGIMFALVLVIELILSLVYPVTNRLSALVHLLASGGFGVITYAILSLKTRSIDLVIGKVKAQGLRRRLHLK